jgi:hypothetical protein
MLRDSTRDGLGERGQAEQAIRTSPLIAHPGTSVSSRLAVTEAVHINAYLPVT